MIYKNKKRGFTVAEIMVAVFIVAILAALLVPMAASQLKRGDEYRYYMTYKTLEKVAKQLVAEPIYENTTALNNEQLPKIASGPSRVTFEEDTDTFKIKFDNAKDIIANILTPPAYATAGASCSVANGVATHQNSSGNDDEWCCNGKREAYKPCPNAAGVIDCEHYYSGDNCYGYGEPIPDPPFQKEDVIDLYTFQEFGELVAYYHTCRANCTTSSGTNACKKQYSSCADGGYCGTLHGTMKNAYFRNYSKCALGNAKPDGTQDETGYTGFKTRFISLISPIIPYIDWDKFECRLNYWYFQNSNHLPSIKKKDAAGNEIEVCQNPPPSNADCPANNTHLLCKGTHNLAKNYDSSGGTPNCPAVRQFGTGAEDGIGKLGTLYQHCFNQYDNQRYDTKDYHLIGNGDGSWSNINSLKYLYALIEHKDQANGAKIRFAYDMYGPAEIRDMLKIKVIITSDTTNVERSGDYTKTLSAPASPCAEPEYIKMKLDDTTKTCVCQDNYTLTRNDRKACKQNIYNINGVLKPCSLGSEPYYNRYVTAGGIGSKCCAKGSFNPKTGKCCGPFDGSGYVYTGGKCVETQNPYVPVGFLNDGQDLCEKIKDNWNIKEEHCDLFTQGYYYSQYSSKGKYYSSNQLYNAINGNGHNNQNSIENLKNGRGAFRTLTPNIEFSNGIKLWILGDREASMSGLSYPLHESSHKYARTMCINYAPQKVNNATTASNLQNTYCKGDAQYGFSYCPGENKCYRFLNTYGHDSNILPDARSCCMNYSADDSTKTEAANNAIKRYTPVSGFTVYADINGDGGTGTLWDDVFPFYITTSGNVIPGYPIDASKDPADNPSVFMAGNSASYLPVDVYYYATRDQSKKRVLVSSNVSFARGACIAGLVPERTYYCQNIFDRNPETGANKNTAYEKDKEVCRHNNCLLSVKKKSRLF